MNVGDQISRVPLTLTGNEQQTLDNYRGQWIVLYFYPKDATPGCTLEGQQFRDHYAEFTALNTTVLGVSRDSLKSHENFKAKQQFPFDLISDSTEQLCEQFDVIKMKSMYGKQVRGIERSTFIIDPHGKIQAIWRKVKVPGHVEEVLAKLKSLKN